jgi:hypothetical protein
VFLPDTVHFCCYLLHRQKLTILDSESARTPPETSDKRAPPVKTDEKIGRIDPALILDRDRDRDIDSTFLFLPYSSFFKKFVRKYFLKIYLMDVRITRICRGDMTEFL